MKEELIKLYTQYVSAHHDYVNELYKNGGKTSRTSPTFEGFMQWLMNGGID